ncbi:MAG: hypothetical protein HRU19_28600 [Pseudobacteriovorax sp.]|nr:hypothetical protein [Pseudobacteriovorax sp.]
MIPKSSRALALTPLFILFSTVACNESSSKDPVFSSPGDSYNPISETSKTKVTPGDQQPTTSQPKNDESPALLPGDVEAQPLEFEHRWVGGESGPKPHLAAILEAFNSLKGSFFSTSDFWLTEERAMATLNYRRYAQIREGSPVNGRSIRIWNHPETGEMIQVEVRLTAYPEQPRSKQRRDIKLPEADHVAAAKTLHEFSSDSTQINHMEVETEWHENDLKRRVTIEDGNGIHSWLFPVSSTTTRTYQFREYHQADYQDPIPAKVFPIWEHPAGNPEAVASLDTVSLKYLLKSIPDADASAYSSITDLGLLRSNFNRAEGNTLSGRQQGFWNGDFVMSMVRGILSSLSFQQNTFDNEDQNNVRLVGKYARVFVHPNSKQLGDDLSFQPSESPYFYTGYKPTADGNDYTLEARVRTFGYALSHRLDAFDRLPFTGDKVNNDITALMNTGFDEVQVYWAINTFFDQMQPLGFSDPELSTRPFDAILFNPSIGSRNNAFYSRDTINFTNYTKGNQNYARDNTTIWHEIGHGIQDRMMGDHYRFADSGGLNEGMADILAYLVVAAETKGSYFEGREGMRINNQIGFHLTNESHDDGEAYGGAMRDILHLAQETLGYFDGLALASDLIFETMRLTRDHPGITAEIWFEHMIFADSLVREISLPSGKIRSPGMMRPHIINALKSRNFGFAPDATPASLRLTYNDEPVTNRSIGSRYQPLRVAPGDELTRIPLKVSIADGSEYQFKYPVRVQIQYEGGPLQGAISWQGQKNIYEEFTLESESDALDHTVVARPTCDESNRADGTCSDFVYVKIFEDEKQEPIAKKRFYLHLVSEL